MCLPASASCFACTPRRHVPGAGSWHELLPLYMCMHPCTLPHVALHASLLHAHVRTCGHPAVQRPRPASPADCPFVQCIAWRAWCRTVAYCMLCVLCMLRGAPGRDALGLRHELHHVTKHRAALEAGGGAGQDVENPGGRHAAGGVRGVGGEVVDITHHHHLVPCTPHSSVRTIRGPAHHAIRGTELPGHMHVRSPLWPHFTGTSWDHQGRST